MAKIYKIMIIDDDSMTLSVFEGILRKQGYRVVSAKDGETGLEMMRRNPPNLLILDLLMPTMHGYEVIRQMKEDSALRDIPVIIATGVYTGAANQLDAIRAGANDFLEKPIHPHTMLEKVQKYLS